MLIAIPTEDKRLLFNGHFGDAPIFLIYNENLELIKEIKNSTLDIEEDGFEHHGNPVKAKKIIELLNSIDVLVAKEMGGNMRRVAKRFKLVFSKIDSIDELLTKLKNNLDSNKETILLIKKDSISSIKNKFI